MFKTQKYGVSQFVLVFFMVLCLGIYSDFAMAQKAVIQIQSEQSDPVGEELNSSSDFSEDEQLKQSFMVCNFIKSVIWIPDSNNKMPFTEFQYSFWQPPKKG